MMRYGALTILAALMMSFSSLKDAGAQDVICTECGDTIKIVENEYTDIGSYRDAMSFYDVMKDSIFSSCSRYIIEKESYENALSKYESVACCISYKDLKCDDNSMKKYAGDGLGHVGFDLSKFLKGSRVGRIPRTAKVGGDSKNAILSGRSADLAKFKKEVDETFVELDEYYGSTVDSLYFTDSVTNGSEIWWYRPVFAKPAEPHSPEMIEKPVFVNYDAMFFHNRPLVPVSEENPVIGNYSFSEHDFYRSYSEYTITLKEFWGMDDEQKRKIQGYMAWDAIAEERFGKNENNGTSVAMSDDMDKHMPEGAAGGRP